MVAAALRARRFLKTFTLLWAQPTLLIGRRFLTSLTCRTSMKLCRMTL
jgi:hypothetical protein